MACVVTERADGSAAAAAGATAAATRARAVAALGVAPSSPSGARQVHGTRLLHVAGPPRNPPPAEEADGLHTAAAALPLLVLGADCCVFALAAEDGAALAVVHAGWRGAAAGIPGVAVAALGREHGVAPHRLRAALGPAIGPCCYEVGPEVEAAFAGAAGVAAGAWFRPGPRGRAHLDLAAAVTGLLVAAGVPRERIAPPPACTACDGGRWFSHRRGDGGRQALVAALVR